jgi:hypothetical protein
MFLVQPARERGGYVSGYVEGRFMTIARRFLDDCELIAGHRHLAFYPRDAINARVM